MTIEELYKSCRNVNDETDIVITYSDSKAPICSNYLEMSEAWLNQEVSKFRL